MKIDQNTNKLVIIGNGFDLAHGLKTRYSDFLLWYLEEAMGTLRRDTVYEDCLVTITPNGHSLHFKLASLTAFHSLCKNGAISFVPKNEFVKRIFNQAILYNWVDIENQYYSSLKVIFNAIISGHSLHKLSDLKKLNESLDYIKILLSKYLSILNNISNTHGEIKTHLMFELEGNNREQKNEILFLNFNYTPTIELYKDCLPLHLKIKINNIHGKLNSDNNPIIFGYGDEMDSDYEKIEQLNNNDFTKHMKSFDYLKTRNYQNLLRFIDSGDFDVFIMGHSCGLSDRILLNDIFENINCKRIKIYFYQKNFEEHDFTEKTQEISRHFKSSSRSEMRKKIVPFEDCKPLTTLS